jgi:hypothetical protein
MVVWGDRDRARVGAAARVAVARNQRLLLLCVSFSCGVEQARINSRNQRYRPSCYFSIYSMNYNQCLVGASR